MNTATKVGEIFTKTQTGDTYNKIGDMIIMLAPQAHELIAIDEKNAIYYDVSNKTFISLFHYTSGIAMYTHLYLSIK